MSRFTRKNTGNSHSYQLDGVRVPGVTTVIGILDKPALVNWAAKQSASYAVENWSELSAMPMMDRATKIEKARYATNKKAVVKGNRIHNLGEKLAHGQPVEVPAEIRRQVEAYASFLDRWDMDAVATETPCCHTEYGYAGTFDLIVESPRFGRSLMDIKTGSGVYSEVALQLNAYAATDLRLVEVPQAGPRGGKLASTWVEAPMLDGIDSLLVAHVMDDDVELVPVKMEQRIVEDFLYLLQVYEGWHKRVSWEYRDDDCFDPPIGKPLFPEDVPVRDVITESAPF
jgi:hypothetical protein